MRPRCCFARRVERVIWPDGARRNSSTIPTLHGVVFAFFVLSRHGQRVGPWKRIDTDAPKSFYTQFWHVPRVKFRNPHRRISLRARKDGAGGNRGGVSHDCTCFGRRSRQKRDRADPAVRRAIQPDPARCLYAGPAADGGRSRHRLGIDAKHRHRLHARHEPGAGAGRHRLRHARPSQGSARRPFDARCDEHCLRARHQCFAAARLALPARCRRLHLPCRRLCCGGGLFSWPRADCDLRPSGRSLGARASARSGRRRLHRRADLLARGVRHHCHHGCHRRRDRRISLA